MNTKLFLSSLQVFVLTGVLLIACSTWAQVLTPINDGVVQSHKSQITQIYESTKTAKSAKDYSNIIRNCRTLLAAELSTNNTENVEALMSWALCRRGKSRMVLSQSLASASNSSQSQSVAKQAKSDFDESLSLDPKRYRSYLGRGIILAERQQFETAIRDFEMALSIEPGCHQALFNLAELNLAEKNYKRAVAHYDKLIGFRPSDVEAISGRGHSNFCLTNFQEALADYQKAAKLAPFDDLAKCHVGDAEQMLGNWARAHRCYEIASRSGLFAPALLRDARMLASCADADFFRPEEALKSINMAIELEGKTAESLSVLAAVHAANGNFDLVKTVRAEIGKLESEASTKTRVADASGDSTLNR